MNIDAGAVDDATALGMAAAMKDASKGTDVIGESVKTFSMMGGGKNQKGDVLMSADNVAGAIELIKKMIADDTAKKPAKAGKWAFRASPHAAFLDKGALALASPEVRFKLDREDQPTDVSSYTLYEANKVVEEFMLLATSASRRRWPKGSRL